ncbi:MAG: SHOCT domain-containing protein [Gelidibacter sp.]|uniref:SHOCT domain-containing protein n=1 Tax=Gelidibacter sp. TaxID=2018083 RepID=UPI003263432E
MDIYHGYNFGGMHIIWWFIWMIFIFWIFFTPWNIPGNRRTKDTPLEILQKRYAAGKITTEQYLEQKKLLEKD